MDILERLKNDLKDAMRAGDQKRSSTLRMVFSAIKNKEIEERKKEVGLGGEEVIEVLRKEAKKRKDAIAEYEKAGRPELSAVEWEELGIIEKYLPEELSDDEIKRIIQDGIRETGATSEKDFGALMKVVMPTLKGKASGDRITRFAKEALSSSSAA